MGLTTLLMSRGVNRDKPRGTVLRLSAKGFGINIFANKPLLWLKRKLSRDSVALQCEEVKGEGMKVKKGRVKR